MHSNQPASKVSTQLASSYLHSDSDDAFVSTVNDSASQFGDAVYQRLFDMLAGLQFSVEDARRHWLKLLAHREQLQTMTRRSITLQTALLDYFAGVERDLARPRLVEFSQYQRLLSDGTRDTLTGLFNRKYFEEALAQQLAQAAREDAEFSLLFLDVDDFKGINDRLGHQAGDQVLQHIASTIARTIRDSDTAVRYGGEEFIVMMPGTNCLSAAVLAERIRQVVSDEPLDTGGEMLAVSVSGGIAGFPVHAESAEDLVYRADSALYRAKGAGKNTICLFKDENRRYLRVSLCTALQVKKLGFDETFVHHGISRDIGIGGILFRTSDAIAIGTRLKLSVTLNAEPLLLIGTVVRIEATEHRSFDIGVALSFGELDKLAKSEIGQLLSSSRHPRDSELKRALLQPDSAR